MEVTYSIEQEHFPPQISDVVFLEDGDDHLLSCSFEKPCFFCNDKYSAPDPVYCYGVLMGGIRQGKPGTPTPSYKMSCEQEHHKNKLFSQELLQVVQSPPRIPDVVILEDGDDHLLSCSFEKPCFFCDDKYSTPDPVYCYGVLMGGIRRGKPGTLTPNYKVSCEQEHHNRDFSRIQEDASHVHQDLLSCSQENQGSSCPQPWILGKAPASSVADRLPITLY